MKKSKFEELPKDVSARIVDPKTIKKDIKRARSTLSPTPSELSVGTSTKVAKLKKADSTSDARKSKQPIIVKFENKVDSLSFIPLSTCYGNSNGSFSMVAFSNEEKVLSAGKYQLKNGLEVPVVATPEFFLGPMKDVQAIFKNKLQIKFTLAVGKFFPGQQIRNFGFKAAQNRNNPHIVLCYAGPTASISFSSNSNQETAKFHVSGSSCMLLTKTPLKTFDNISIINKHSNKSTPHLLLLLYCLKT